MSWVQQLTNNRSLRVCINTGNALLAQLDPSSGQPTGISVKLAQALAKEHDVPLDLCVVGTAKAAVQAIANKQADIGFFAIDPERAKDIHFTRAYLNIDACYVVHADASIKNLQDVDRVGHRIVVGGGSAYDLFLSRHILHATLVRASSTPEVMGLFKKGGYEIAAGLQHAMSEEIQTGSGLRMVLPPFMSIAQAMGCHPSHSQEVKQGLDAFVKDKLQQNLIADEIKRQELIGVRPANA